MLIPLKQFICDTCGEVIQRPEDGWVEWISDRKDESSARLSTGFQIVHHITASPLAESNAEGCYTSREHRSHDHLDHFLEEKYKMAHILKFLDNGPYHEPEYRGPHIGDMREYVEFIRRITIPYYEEARLYWQQALDDNYFDDPNEIAIYGTDALNGLVKRYSTY